MPDGVREAAEGFNIGVDRAFESAKLDLVIVASVEKCDGFSFVEPTFELFGWNFRRGVFGGADGFYAKRDDFLFDANQHPIERLFLAEADFGFEPLESWDRS